MTPALNELAEVIAKANDLFTQRHQKVDTVIGIMDKVLRKQGMAADAVTIDAVALNKKIVFLLRDAEPDVVEVALGNKDGDIYSSEKQDTAVLTPESIVIIMESNFITH
ncbi:hypothetical protein [Thalassotalea atypica]|uniref:hypothetical protein n=1 Tax=Thalassotalea atypica TaxID=2054316 RepID=UPI00257238E9|nr:hypothetical protein [Thalassotalea atypica]